MDRKLNKVIAEYLATLSSGKEIPLKLIYSDPTADIAVFQGDLKDMGLTEDLSLSSDSIQTGTNVLIIGKRFKAHFE